MRTISDQIKEANLFLDNETNSLKSIAHLVCEECGLRLHEFHNRRRCHQYSHARQLFCLLAREHTDKSLPQIGRFLNNDHSTILYAVKQARKRVQDDPVWARRYHAVSAFLRRDL